MRVSARDYQRKHRKMKLCISSLPLLKQHRVDMSLKMIHGNQRLLQRKSERLGETDANQQSARQSRPLRDRDGIDRRISLSRLGQRLPHHRNDSAQVLARSEFRKHSAI